MKKNKMFTSMAAVALVLSLAACGKSATDSSTTTSDADSVSSHKVVKSSKSSSSSDKKSSSSDESSTSSETSNDATSRSTTKKASSSAVATQSESDSNSDSTNDQQTLDEARARGLLKVHFGTQAGDNQQSAKVTQTQTDAVDNMAATHNGNNTWTFTGTVNGQQVSYTVSPTSIYQN